MSKLSSKKNLKPTKSFKRGFGQQTQFSQNADFNVYLYTKGKEYTDLDGKEYVGEYHIRKDGKVFTGPVELDQENNNAIQLLEYYGNQDVFTYDKRQRFYTPIKDHAQPIPYQYVVRPEDGDYRVGFSMRYFVQKFNNTGYAIEIDRAQRDAYGSTLGIDSNLYNVVDLQWRLTGTLEAIEEENKNNVMQANMRMSGLALAISNYTQYAQPTNSSNFPNIDSLLVNPKLNNNNVPIKKTFNPETGNII